MSPPQCRDLQNSLKNKNKASIYFYKEKKEKKDFKGKLYTQHVYTLYA